MPYLATIVDLAQLAPKAAGELAPRGHCGARPLRVAPSALDGPTGEPMSHLALDGQAEEEDGHHDDDATGV